MSKLNLIRCGNCFATRNEARVHGEIVDAKTIVIERRPKDNYKEPTIISGNDFKVNCGSCGALVHSVDFKQELIRTMQALQGTI